MTPQCIDHLQHNMEHGFDHALGSCLEQELWIDPAATYSGYLIWKINELDHWRRNAINGMSLYSTPFYTGCHGYNGLGLGLGHPTGPDLQTKNQCPLNCDQSFWHPHPACTSHGLTALLCSILSTTQIVADS